MLTITTLSSEAGRSSSYLVRSQGRGLLVDAGPGTLRALDDHGGLRDIRGVAITHGHADHCLDLVAIAYARRFPAPAPDPLPLWLPAETLPVIEALDGVFGVPTLEAMRRPIAQSFDIRPLDLSAPEAVDIWDDLSLTPFPARHAVACAALRLDSPAGTVAFSGDTGYAESVIAAAEAVDAFFCEATYLQATAAELEGHGHLTPRLAAQMAARARSRKLVLTHLSRTSDGQAAIAEASRHFTGPVIAAARGETVRIGE